MPLVKRLIKGSPLTYQEMDDNLSYLDNKVTGSNQNIAIFSGSVAISGSNTFRKVGSDIKITGSLYVSQTGYFNVGTAIGEDVFIAGNTLSFPNNNAYLQDVVGTFLTTDYGEGVSLNPNGTYNRVTIGNYSAGNNKSNLFVNGDVNISGSTFLTGSLKVTNSTTITGSLNISGSNTLRGTKIITGSVFISGSKTIIGTNIITGSLLVSGSTIVTGSISNTTTITTTALITPQTITEVITIPNNYNGMLIGPVGLNTQVTVAGNATLVII
jgi:hypothetical protein